MTVKRGYQGTYRYRLLDLETESSRPLTTDQVQVCLFRLERLESGELPERCKGCKGRTDADG